MFCKNCGKKIDEDSKNCSYCGASVNGSVGLYPRNNVAGVESTKNLGLAIALSFLFGPFGLLYATVRGAIILFAAGIGSLCIWFIGMSFVAGAGSQSEQAVAFVGFYMMLWVFIAFGIWAASIVWAWKAVTDYNANVRRGLFNNDAN